MASVHREVLLNVGAERVWRALRDVANTARLFAGVLTEGRLDGDVRTVTFVDGRTVRERIVDIDEGRRRLAYGVLNEAFVHHSASMQIVPVADDACRFVWISDVLPDSMVANVAPLMEAGCRALKRNVEAEHPD